MDEVYFQYLHQLAIESPMFRKWRNLQNGEIYKYDRIEHLKPEDEDKLLKALRGASARHHRRQEKKGDPWGIRSRHPFSYDGMSKLPAVIIPPGVARIDNMEMLAKLAETMPYVETANDRSLAEAQEGARAELELDGERADRMDAEANERSAERDRLAAELGGGEGGALSPRRAR